jgi:hypothetical protein
LFGKGPRQEEIALESQVNMFIEEIVTGNTILALSCQGLFGVGEADARVLPPRAHSPHQVIEPAITAKAQHIQVACSTEMLPGLRTLAKRQRALTLAKP